MELSKFKNLCKTFGRSDTIEGEEWKTVKYLHTPGQGSPSTDIERSIDRGLVEFEESLPGFIITEPPSPDVIIAINDDTAVNTFVDLNMITDVSLQIDDDIRDIYDVVSKVTNCKLPLRVVFIVDPTTKYYNYGGVEIPIYEYDNTAEVKVPFKVTKPGIVHGTDYEITIKDLKSGTTVDEIASKGEYIITIDGIDKYYGTSSALIKVTN